MSIHSQTTVSPDNANQSVRCPTCNGRGTSNAIINFRPHGRAERLSCIPCGGKGFISAARAFRHRTAGQPFRRLGA